MQSAGDEINMLLFMTKATAFQLSLSYRVFKHVERNIYKYIRGDWNASLMIQTMNWNNIDIDMHIDMHIYREI